LSDRSVIELKAQLESARAELAAAIAAESQTVLDEIRDKVALFGFTEKDLFSRRRATRSMAAKYQHPETGQTWNGRGRPPAWVRHAPSLDKLPTG
jgi:DNA-binding protein H-NS